MQEQRSREKAPRKTEEREIELAVLPKWQNEEKTGYSKGGTKELPSLLNIERLGYSKEGQKSY